MVALCETTMTCASPQMRAHDLEQQRASGVDAVTAESAFAADGREVYAGPLPTRQLRRESARPPRAGSSAPNARARFRAGPPADALRSPCGSASKRAVSMVRPRSARHRRRQPFRCSAGRPDAGPVRDLHRKAAHRLRRQIGPRRKASRSRRSVSERCGYSRR